MNQRLHVFFFFGGGGGLHMAKIKSKFDSTLNEKILTSVHDPLTLNYF